MRKFLIAIVVALVAVLSYPAITRAASLPQPPVKVQKVLKHRATVICFRRYHPCTVQHWRHIYRSLVRWWWQHHHPLIPAVASWYGPGLYGNTMACGGTLTQNSMVVANKTMACGTRLRICWNGRCTIARVEDRGPFVPGREFDLGPGTARALGFSGVHTIRYSRA